MLTDLRSRSGEVRLGLICERQKQLDLWRELPVEYVIPHSSLITQDLVEEVRHAGRLLITWTVNDKRSMLRLAKWGVNGIISDDTELLVQAFS